MSEHWNEDHNEFMKRKNIEAAAPELLEACKAALENCEYEHIRIVLRAAIAKAEGKA